MSAIQSFVLVDSLRWVRASYLTPFGRIAVRWKKGRHFVRLRVRVPHRRPAEIVLGEKRVVVMGRRIVRVKELVGASAGMVAVK